MPADDRMPLPHANHTEAAAIRPLTWSQVLDEEDRALAGVENGRREASPPGPASDEEATRLKAVVARLHTRGRSALCLSGGGVRSATFALGVLQGLANVRVLDRFDYLSTVSGGGYIGGWLTAWLRREGTSAVLSSLDPEQASSATRSTRSPVERVRETSRFLAPQGGAVSADVWTLLATMGRNLILNWLVLLPLIGAALLVPHLYFAVVKALEISQLPTGTTRCFAPDQPAVWLLAVTVVAFAVQTGYIAMSFAGRGARWSQHSFLLFVLAPSVIGSVAFTLFWSAFPCLPTLNGYLFLGAVIPATGWLVVGVLARPSVRAMLLAAAALTASLYAWSKLPADLGSYDSRAAGLQVALPIVFLFVALGVISRRLTRDQPNQPRDGDPQVVVRGRTIAAALASGPVLGGGLYLLVVRDFPFTTPFSEAYAVFAVPAILMIWALATVLFIGLASADFSDAALEWWSRCGAWIGIAAAAWLAAFVFDFYLADLVEAGIGFAKSGLGMTGISLELQVAVIIPLLSSVAGLLARSSPVGRPPSRVRLTLQAVGLPLVILVLLSSIAWADSRALGVYGSQAFGIGARWIDPASAVTRLTHVLGLGGGLLLIGLVMSRFVPVNRFSLNGMYRERLIRTFLGASNPTREPNAFTGFDPRDDIRIHQLAGVRPLHVVNATLNALSATEFGRNDRTAQPFTFSPLHVGSRQADFGYRAAAGYHSDRGDKAPGLSLGLALAVSGAAASSAMGIYSSKARAFLLTLANARLGLWFGNPADDSTWCASEPPLGVGPLAREILGLTTKGSPFVYLSDGGHFENLGLYEMVARRCRFIVVSDAGCDPDYTYGALADAIRRIRLDFGIPIEFGAPLAATHDGEGRGNPHGAIGAIRYAFVDGPAAPDGTLVYMKATLSGTEPVDVWNFAKSNPAFPHDPTTDQFFDEARFESYRSLGFHTVKALAGNGFHGEGGVQGFCEAARRSLADRHAAPASPMPVSAPGSMQATGYASGPGTAHG